MGFTIRSRIYSAEGRIMATVAAAPLDTGALAIVRAREVRTHEEAAEILESMVRSLGLELTAQGDRFSIE
jgi:hypothetical protein